MIQKIRAVKKRLITFCICKMVDLPYNSTWEIVGKPIIQRYSRIARILGLRKSGTISIGNHFVCKNKVASNTIGLIQPTIFNVVLEGSEIVIGDNVGISGATINAAKSVRIGNNVMIGSGCIITDTDSHPIRWQDRLENPNSTVSKPIVIEDNVFIGARSIILKGVTIGFGSVVGAGSVVSKDVPPNVIVCGNPARIVKHLE